MAMGVNIPKIVGQTIGVVIVENIVQNADAEDREQKSKRRIKRCSEHVNIAMQN